MRLPQSVPVHYPCPKWFGAPSVEVTDKSTIKEFFKKYTRKLPVLDDSLELPTINAIEDMTVELLEFELKADVEERQQDLTKVLDFVKELAASISKGAKAIASHKTAKEQKSKRDQANKTRELEKDQLAKAKAAAKAIASRLRSKTAPDTDIPLLKVDIGLFTRSGGHKWPK